MANSSSIFFGGSLVAAVIAGAVALFAPCCVSVMLPSFLATSTHNRRHLVAMTFLFAGGIASIIVPIALGAAVLRRVMISQHAPIYVAGGVLLVGLGLYTLLGGRLRLVVPGRRAGARSGPFSVYALGVFAGITSSCCAPVLAGVVALSGVASSFLLALGLAVAYVFGMVAPLFLIALAWERYDWKASRLFRTRTFRWRLGPLHRSVTASALVGGAVLVGMGGLALWVGVQGQAMPTPSGWQAHLSARLAHYGHVMTEGLDWIPSWAAAVALAVVIALLARRALRQLHRSQAPGSSIPDLGVDTYREDLVGPKA